MFDQCIEGALLRGSRVLPVSVVGALAATAVTRSVGASNGALMPTGGQCSCTEPRDLRVMLMPRRPDKPAAYRKSR